MNKDEEQKTLTEAVDSCRSDNDWDSYEWRQKREQRLKIDDYQCCGCGRSDLQLHVHHIVPDTNGGVDRIENLRTLCYNCHNKTHIEDVTPLSGRSNSSTIPIDRELATALRKWLAIRPDPIPSVEGDPVFLNISDNWGGEITPSVVRSRMKKYAIESGMYGDAKDVADNVTPITLSQFFKVRFGGQPMTCDYILGKCKELPYPYPQLVNDYREGVPQLIE